VHADVHSIVVSGPAAPNRQVWVGCDGGVYLSTRSGRVNTFASRATGLAVLQAGYVAAHPTSTHFVAAGFQDNGTQVRSGDTLWEEIMLGDGGGLMFHSALSQYVVAQFVTASWSSAPAQGFVSPTSRIPGGGTFNGDREAQQGVSEFYSGGSAIGTDGNTARIAVGTNRVWMSDNLGQAAANRWRVLPFPAGPLSDPRFANGNERPGQSDTGVPAGPAPLGPVIPAWWPGAVGNVGPLRGVVTVKWQSPTSLIAVFLRGVVQWVESPAGQWTATVLVRSATLPARPLFTDAAVIPLSQDFYLTTTGSPTSTAVDTCYLWDSATSTLNPTGQLHRAQLRLAAGRFIDRLLWNAVVGGTRLAPDLTVSGSAGHPLAVYRPARQTPLDPNAVATEVDLLESVQPRSVTGGRWFVFSEPSTVDVLLHHRDTRPVTPLNAFAMLLWRSDPSSTALLATPADGIVAWARGVAGGGFPPAPAGWEVGGPPPGRNALTVPLDARLPRAVPIDVDLSAVPRFHRVLLLGVGGSAADPCGTAPVGLPANPTVTDLVQRWPYAALRMVTVSPR